MTQEREAKQNFNEAAEALPQTDFAASLCKFFDHETARGVLDIFQRIGLPAPEAAKEYMDGAHGKMTFLNCYGLVIRIEKKHSEFSDRINDSPWVLPPVASLEAGKAIIEIVPAVSYETDLRNRNIVEERLLQEGIKFWDLNIRNVGRIPARTPAFPDGIPAVIDRPSVRKEKEQDREAIHSAQLKLTKEDTKSYQEAAEAIENLYGPLRELFSECLKTQKMKQFWESCQRYVQGKKLIAGWNEANADEDAPDEDFDDQANWAANVAMHYEERLWTLNSAVRIETSNGLNGVKP